MRLSAIIGLVIAAGLLIICAYAIDWSPDVTQEESREMLGVPDPSQELEKLEELARQASRQASSPRQQEAGAVASTYQDAAGAVRLAQADDRQSADLLAKLLYNYAPRPRLDDIEAGRTPALHEARQQARQSITDMIVRTRNPHMYSTLATSLNTLTLPGYVAAVCDIVSQRGDEGSLQLVWQQLQKMGDAPAPARRKIVNALVRYPHGDVRKLIAPVLEDPDNPNRAVALEIQNVLQRAAN
jgi:hypothetical protein